MTAVVEVTNLTKHYRKLTALDGVTFAIADNTIVGLLGRNGAGKTTLMSILAAHAPATSGQVAIFGQSPWENEAVLERVCSVRESVEYPTHWKAQDALACVAVAFPNWDARFCDELVSAFELPLKRSIAKLSRGQKSAVGIVIGLAARAEVTIFDEPYLGLDAVMRQRFYDTLLADYTEHPRTIILSSHLIDEIADLIEHVLVIDHGRLLIDASADDLRGSAIQITGDAATVDAATAGHDVIHRETLGRVASVTVLGHVDGDQRAELSSRGLQLGPVSLQQLIVRRTQGALPEGPEA